MYLFKMFKIVVLGGVGGGEGQATPAALDDHNLVPGSTPLALSGSIQNTKFTTEDKHTKYRIWNTKYHNFVPGSTWLRLYLVKRIKVVDDGNGNRYKAKTFFTKRASEANKERMLWMQGLEGNSGASMAVRGIPEARNRKGLRGGRSWGKWLCSICPICPICPICSICPIWN